MSRHGDDVPELEALDAVIEHRCVLCAFFTHQPDSTQGECHALPPQVNMLVTPGGPPGVLSPGGPAFAPRPQINFVSKWPDVQADGWCGYFRPSLAALSAARDFEERVRGGERGN